MTVLAGQRLAGRLIVGAIVVAASVLGAASMVSVNSDRAAELATIDSALLSLETTHLLIDRAVLLTVDFNAGLTTESEVDLAVSEARQALGNLGAGEGAETSVYVAGGYALIEQLAGGNVAAAREAATQLNELHTDLAGQLTTRRIELAGNLRTARSVAGIAGSISGVALGLAIPLLLVLLYRRQARRQVATAELETRRAAAAEVGRTKDEFIANLSHELRTPLTSIYGFAQVLEDGEVFDPESALELINLIIVESSDLARMVEDLLTAARWNAGVLSYETAPIPVEDLVADLIGAYRRVRAISIDIEPGEVLADPVRLRQILRNLLSNGVRYGGPNVRLTGRSVGDQYLVEVVDDGEGVPADLVPVMFERFLHTGTKPLLAGSVGLGLHIAKALAQGMGSDVTYQHSDGWTRFGLALERAEARVAAGV